MSEPDTLMEFSDDMYHTVQALADVREDIRALVAAEKDLKVQVLNLLDSTNADGYYQGQKVCSSRTQARESFNTAEFRKAYPDLFRAYTQWADITTVRLV